jgi:hypothetical protein
MVCHQQNVTGNFGREMAIRVPAKFLGKSQEIETRTVSDRFLTAQKSSNHVN